MKRVAYEAERRRRKAAAAPQPAPGPASRQQQGQQQQQQPGGQSLASKEPEAPVRLPNASTAGVCASDRQHVKWSTRS